MKTRKKLEKKLKKQNKYSLRKKNGKGGKGERSKKKKMSGVWFSKDNRTIKLIMRYIINQKMLFKKDNILKKNLKKVEKLPK